MRHRWPADTQFTRMVLDVEEEVCGVCGRNLHICDHRQHRIFSLQGPLAKAAGLNLAWSG